MPCPEPGGQRSVPLPLQALREGGGTTPCAVPRLPSAPRPGHAGGGRGWSVRCAMAGAAKGSPERPAEEEVRGRLSVCSKLCYAIGGAPNQVAGSATAFFLQIYLLDIAHDAGMYTLHSSVLLFYVVPASFCIRKSCMVLDFLLPFPSTDHRMTMEVLGTLIGAAVQGQIVASAHVSHHCTVNPPVNTTDSWHDTSSFPDPLDPLSHQAKVYMIAAGVIGGVYLLGILILFLGVKEKDDPYALNSDRAIPFCKGLGLTMKHGPYMKLTASFLLISTAVQLEQSNFVLFCTHAADLRSHFQYLVVTILVSAAVSIPFWQKILQRFGKKCAAFGIAWMTPFAAMLVTIPNLILAYFVAFVSGLSIAASLLLPWSMLPDVVDNFRLQNPHGKGHETLFYSSYVFFTKMSAGIGLGISAAGLEFTGYKPGVCRQSNDVILTLKILTGAVPAILIFVGLFILLFYPITEESRRETKLALEVLRRSHQSTETLDKEDTSV
ncbi:sphingosine-1-phosphate transporter MFSD2B isoform 6-T6 [Guaruba guarouba]